MFREPEVESGASVIRRGLHARRGQLAIIARDLGASAEALHNFLAGGRLTPALLSGLANRIWNGALEYDAASDQLGSANKAEPTTIGRAVPPMPRQEVPKHHGKGPSGPTGAPTVARPSWIRW